MSRGHVLVHDTMRRSHTLGNEGLDEFSAGVHAEEHFPQVCRSLTCLMNIEGEVKARFSEKASVQNQHFERGQLH